MIPYIVFSVAHELIWTIAKHNQWMGMLFPNTIEVPINGALWFLPAMFFADLIAFTILKYIPGLIGYFILAAISVIGSIHLIVLPFSIDSALTSVGFILIGYLIKMYGKKLLELKVMIAILALIFFTHFFWEWNH